MLELNVVLNEDYGGFHLTKEMAEWMKKEYSQNNKKKKKYDYKQKYPINTLLDMGGNMFINPSNNDSIEFRSNQDLIKCVLHFKKVHENDDYMESRYGQIHSLNIKNVQIELGIKDYNDGKEKVYSNILVEDDEEYYE